MGDIKTLKPNFNGKYHQGYYKPNHPEKYVGKYPIIYRSSWELKLCILCDTDNSVLKWISEPNVDPFPLAYYHPVEERVARYFPDYLVLKREPDNSISKMMIEVKPEAQTQHPPKPAYNASLKQRKSYIEKCKIVLVNLAKKAAAEDFCKSHSGFTYHFLTEKFFNKIN